MQSRTTPSLLQISKKRRLTGEDAGRALLICTADSAISGQPSSLPENVAEYINTTLPYSPTDMEIYRSYLSVCNYLSHQRALADAHAIRFFGYLTTLLKTLETSIAVEEALRFFCSDPAQAENAYTKCAPFTGFGIESFIPDLYEGAELIRNGTRLDAANSLISRRTVAAFNASVKLIGEETHVDLGVLLIDTTPFDEKAATFNTASAKLRALVADSPMKTEKLAVLDEFFGSMQPFSAISFTESSICHARSMLKDLKLFLSGNEPNFYELLEEQTHDA